MDIIGKKSLQHIFLYKIRGLPRIGALSPAKIFWQIWHSQANCGNAPHMRRYPPKNLIKLVLKLIGKVTAQIFGRGRGSFPFLWQFWFEGTTQRWKNVQILQIYLCYFFSGCANFLAVCVQTSYKKCAISTVLKTARQKHFAKGIVLKALCY